MTFPATTPKVRVETRPPLVHLIVRGGGAVRSGPSVLIITAIISTNRTVGPRTSSDRGSHVGRIHTLKRETRPKGPLTTDGAHVNPPLTGRSISLLTFTQVLTTLYKDIGHS